MLGTIAWALPAVAQGDPARVAREVAKAFRRSGDARDLASCRDALAATAGVDSAKVADALIDAYVKLEREADEISADRAKVLQTMGGSAVLGPLRHRLRPIRELQDGILGRLAEARAAETVTLMLDSVLRGRNLPWTLRALLAGHARFATDDDLEKLVTAAGRTHDGDAAMSLLRAVASLGERAQAVGEWAVSLLASSDAAVRAEAATTLGKLGWRGALRPMIDRLDAETGAGREVLLDALVTLTGVYPGATLDAWRLWLEQEGGPWLDGTRRLGQGDPSIRRRDSDSGTRTTYFGIAQDGGSLLYVIDVSISMRQEIGDATRWDLCKRELSAALRGLRTDQKFNIVAFANHVRKLDDELQPATPETIERAIDWVGRLQLEGETNIYDALELAFLLAGRGARDRYYEPEIDTVFLLTDGAPTLPRDPNEKREPRTGAGNGGGRGPGRGGGMRFDRPADILAEVRRWNALGRVAIHTIGLGLDAPQGAPQGGGGQGGGGRRGGGMGGGMVSREARPFLKDLAAENRGRFVEPK